MKKLFLAFLGSTALASPVAAQSIRVDFEGNGLASCNGSGGGAACSGSTTWSQQVNSTIQTWDKRGWATSGATLSTMQSRKAALIAAKPTSGKWVVPITIGANDLIDGAYATDQSYIDALIAYTTDLRNAGARVVISTIPANNAGSGAQDTAFNNRRKVVNAFIRRYRFVLFDEVMDFAADDNMGPDNATANATYFTDETNPTAAGHTVLADIARQSMQAAAANEVPGWTVGPQTITFTDTIVLGRQLSNHPESSTAEQGGDPPVLFYEPKDINTIAGYNRSQWVYAHGGEQRTDQGEAKFRTVCTDVANDPADPLLARGLINGPHWHTYIGNRDQTGNFQFANYLTLRTLPGSSCGGGPLNSSLYWRPAMQKKRADGLVVSIKADAINFYYTIAPYSITPKLYRLFNDISFIGGVNPSDITNSAYLAKIPDGQGWDKSQAYNGWTGWQCMNAASGGGTTVLTTTGQTHSKVLKNADGSDPWGGMCLAGYSIGAIVNGPDCLDGVNLRSVDGRSHVAYSIRKADNSITGKCPDTFIKMPHLEGKEWWTLQVNAEYLDWCLSSDNCWDPVTANRKTPGSTFHFDYIFAWDNWAAKKWQKWCTGITINGDVGVPLTCDFSAISPTEIMQQGASSDTRFSGTIVVDVKNWSLQPNSQRFFPVAKGTKGDFTIHTNH